MKKTILPVFMFSAALLLSGCGSTGTSAVSSASAEDESAEVTEPEETEETAADDSVWWQKYTDAVGKKDTDLNFMGLGLTNPFSWEDLIPYIEETNIMGRRAGETEAAALTAEEMLETDAVLEGTLSTITVKGTVLEFSLGIPYEEKTTVPLSESVKNGRFVLNTNEGHVEQFLDIPDSAIPSDADHEHEYWLFEMILDRYGQPDLISNATNLMTAFFWEREGYWIEVQAIHMPEDDYMVVDRAVYIPSTVWEYYANDFLPGILGWQPLVTYEEAVK